MKLKTKTKPKAKRLPADQRSIVGASVRKGTGLPVDLALLGGHEQHELHALVLKIAAGSEQGVVRTSASYLDERDRKRYEALVEKAAELPGHFAKQRDDATMRTKLRELARRVNQPPPRPRYEEPGAVVVPRETVFEFVRDGILWVEHLGLFVFLLGQLENGEALSPGARVEDGALVVNRTGLGVRFFDEDCAAAAAWRRHLDHLVANHLLAVEAKGQELWIRRGPRALAVIDNRKG